MSLTVTTSSVTYPIIVDDGALETLPARLAEFGLRGRLWLVSDAGVAAQFGEPLAERLRAAGREVQSFVVPSGEASKSPEQLGQLYDWLIGGGVERRDALLALGGGVVGDLAGYAAATVLRGVALVQLPTTLLAMVDSAIGGKTGINHALGKNLIGAFHQPRLVLADTATLTTLPPRELRAGMAEVIKHGVIRDAGLFEELEALAATRGWTDTGRDGFAAWAASDAARAGRLTAIIRRAVAVKVAVVNVDEREEGERITLNYGHTLGHAIEKLAEGWSLLHGEAVAIGMHAAARIAAAMGLCGEDLVERQRALLAAYGLAVAVPDGLDPEAVLATAMRDKKVRAGRIRWVLPTALGHVVVRDDVPEAVVRSALQAV
ncbi:MAG: 3-dehydroquinate synthase [Chloroflexi bacterium OHK40]